MRRLRNFLRDIAWLAVATLALLVGALVVAFGAIWSPELAPLALGLGLGSVSLGLLSLRE